MRNVTLSDADLIAYSGEHLLYELQHLWFTASELRRFTESGPMVSVLIESFGIHLRNLIDFFGTPAGKEKPDDVIACDFCPGWQEDISSTLRNARERANKELNHLTLRRKSDHDPTKPWDVQGLLREVNTIAARFAAQASSTKLNPEIGKWLQNVNRPTITVVAGPRTTSTTASIVTTSFIR